MNIPPKYEDVVAQLEHWRDLALQFDNHRMTAIWHLKTLVSDGTHYDAAAAFLSAPPATATDIQQRLTVAEQRAGEMETALSNAITSSVFSRGLVELENSAYYEMEEALNKSKEGKVS